MVKLDLDELDKAVQWIKINSLDTSLHIEESGVSLKIKTTDKENRWVNIEIFDKERSKRFMQITKTERLIL